MSRPCWRCRRSRALTASCRSASRAGPEGSAAWTDCPAEPNTALIQRCHEEGNSWVILRGAMTARRIDASAVAREFRDQIRQQVARLHEPLTLVGFLASEAAPSRTYADYTRIGCEDLGIRFDLREVARLEVEDAIQRANDDPTVHGIIVYYPIFALERDRFIQDLVDQRKDIEGLNSFWARKLYRNERFVDAAKTQKAILPCTPLSVLKLLEAAGCMASPAHGSGPLGGKRI